MKKIYCYFFYTIYKFYESIPLKWWSDWKSYVTMLLLEIWTIASLFFIYTDSTGNFISGKLLWTVGVFILMFLILIKYWIFINNDQWRSYVNEFDSWPSNKNRIWSIFAWLVVILLFINIFFSI